MITTHAENLTNISCILHKKIIYKFSKTNVTIEILTYMKSILVLSKTLWNTNAAKTS